MEKPADGSLFTEISFPHQQIILQVAKGQWKYEYTPHEGEWGGWDKSLPHKQSLSAV